jgi:hypothetical protein
MNHIKLFENFDSDYYKLITSEEFISLIKEANDISHKYKDRLRSLVENRISRDISGTRGYFPGLLSTTYYHNIFPNISKRFPNGLYFYIEDYVEVFIWELPDEYFLVIISMKHIFRYKYSFFYKCDQWGGVENLIKNEKILEE